MKTLVKRQELQIPTELRNLNQWILTDSNKIPWQTNGHKAKCNDSSTWDSFDNCFNTLETSDKFKGIGFQLSLNDNYVIVDIDKIDRNEESKFKFINTFTTYTEKSQSGNGYHLIFKIDDINIFLEEAKKLNLCDFNIKKTLSCKQGDFEIYMSDRYFWLTGDIIDSKTSIETIDTFELVEIFEYIQDKKDSTFSISNNTQNVNKSPKLSNDEILELCKKAKNHNKFEKLWNEKGDIGCSEGDQSLLNILSFYTQDIEQLCELMKLSNRNRNKFTRLDYLRRSARKSVSIVTKVYKGNTGSNIEWDKDFIKIDKKGNQYPILSTSNLKILFELENIEIKYNEMLKVIEFNNERLEDRHDLYVYELCNNKQYNFKQLKETMIPKIIDSIAYENKYHPVKEYLDSLEPMNSTIEIDKLWNTLELSENSDKTFSKKLLLTWLKMAIDSIYNKEFKSQGVLTLQGTGGIGKSTWLSKLVKDKTFFKGETVGFDVNNKDSYDKITSAWISELAELESTFRKDFIALKGFITSEYDEYRLPYARRNKKYKRQTILAASVNSQEFLRDDTGDRRFWILEIVSINWNLLDTIDIDKLWSELLYLYNKEGININYEYMVKIKDINNQYRIKSTLEDIMESLIIKNDKNNCKFYTTNDLCLMISKEYPFIKNVNSNNIGKVLTNLGYSKIRKSINGKQTRGYELSLKQNNLFD